MKYPCFRISQGLTALANHGESQSRNVVRIDPEMRTTTDDSSSDGFEGALSELRINFRSMKRLG